VQYSNNSNTQGRNDGPVFFGIRARDKVAVMVVEKIGVPVPELEGGNILVLMKGKMITGKGMTHGIRRPIFDLGKATNLIQIVSPRRSFWRNQAV